MELLKLEFPQKIEEWPLVSKLNSSSPYENSVSSFMAVNDFQEETTSYIRDFISLKLLKMMIRVTSRYVEGEASALHL